MVCKRTACDPSELQWQGVVDLPCCFGVEHFRITFWIYLFFCSTLNIILTLTKTNATIIHACSVRNYFTISSKSDCKTFHVKKEYLGSIRVSCTYCLENNSLKSCICRLMLMTNSVLLLQRGHSNTDNIITCNFPGFEWVRSFQFVIHTLIYWSDFNIKR